MEQPIIGKIEMCAYEHPRRTKIQPPIDAKLRDEIRKIVREELDEQARKFVEGLKNYVTPGQEFYQELHEVIAVLEPTQKEYNTALNMMRFALASGKRRVFIYGEPNGNWVFRLGNCPKDPNKTPCPDETD